MHLRGIEKLHLYLNQFLDYGSSSQSYQLIYSIYEQLFQPYLHYGNYHPNLYTCCRTKDDDFEPPHHSTWNRLLYCMFVSKNVIIFKIK